MALIPVFCPTDGAARIFTMITFFLPPPVTNILAGAHDDWHCERESARGEKAKLGHL